MAETNNRYNIGEATSKEETRGGGNVTRTETGENVSGIVDTLSIASLKTKTIDRTFGRPDDYVELHVYNNNNQLIFSGNNTGRSFFGIGTTFSLSS